MLQKILSIFLLIPSFPLAQGGIRIVPQTISVSNDSLHIRLEMDLNEVRVGSSTAILFTPLIQGAKVQEQILPSVVISGKKRARQDRREHFLSPGKEKTSSYLVICEGRHAPSKTITYQVAVPYIGWMQHATLLLKQESRECCGFKLLAVDTLKHDLLLAYRSAAPEIKEQQSQFVPAKAHPVPLQTTSTQKHQTVVAPRPVTSSPATITNTTGIDFYTPMVSYLVPDVTINRKMHTESAVLYFDYPIGKDDIYPDYQNNREEIDKIDRIMAPLQDNRFSEVSRIRICGYSSPDGNYGDNERLAKARSSLFSSYLRNAYGIPRSLVEVTSVAEDWEGLSDLLQQEQPTYLQSVLEVIRRYGIFSGREKQLMELQGGAPYKDMLRRIFPKLRRIEVVVQYNVRKIGSEEAADLIYTHPDLLSLEEIYAVARYYRPGTEQYREVYEIAAFHFPDDVIANVNAASAVMLAGDLQSAWNYLQKVEADPRSWNNMGVLTLMEGDAAGAAVWFRKAVGIEPRKARKNLEIAESYIKTGK